MQRTHFYTDTNNGIALREHERREFERAITVLRGEVANVAAHMAVDGATRAAYDRQVTRYAEELRAKARAGKIPWRQAAKEANEIRNLIMQSLRGRSTPVGRALAEYLKKEGKTLNEMIAKKTIDTYGKGADFNKLSAVQKNRVYSEVVKSAGKSSPKWTPLMRKVSTAGRGLIVLSLSVSVYVIATSDDKVAAAKKEGAVLGAGIAGGVAGGALAGLACGPGAPVCVTVGAFVGGALAAFGVDMFF
ncbi:hypothetical protein C8N43_2530 [Litoreibacter ponti]|uniref:Uncharacterized protein n=1 Tax=Litoreibacter ponti TaxID=1510457 RepID=A0A2T6BPF8_9RHOB|nr:hypothetical protein [Litoreibacter ponti]PTX57857.1 hypothetical protein C8N43_2530 [Litoreibacter ponti]